MGASVGLRVPNDFRVRSGETDPEWVWGRCLSQEGVPRTCLSQAGTGANGAFWGGYEGATRGCVDVQGTEPGSPGAGTLGSGPRRVEDLRVGEGKEWPHVAGSGFWVESGPHRELCPADHAGTLRSLHGGGSCPPPGPQHPAVGPYPAPATWPAPVHAGLWAQSPPLGDPMGRPDRQSGCARALGGLGPWKGLGAGQEASTQETEAAHLAAC